MIIVMKADILPESAEVQQVIRMVERYPDVQTEVRKIQGATRVLTEIYLLGSTSTIPQEPFEEFSAVEKVIRIRERYRSIGRHEGQAEAIGFEYNGIHFGQDSFHVFPGVCAVDTRENLKEMRGAVLACGQPLHAWGDGGFESSGRKTWPCATQKSPWQGAWVVASLGWTARLFSGTVAAGAAAAEVTGPASDSIGDDARALYEWLAHYYTRAYTSVGESFTAPDGTKVTWVNGHHALSYSFPAATYQPELVGGVWKERAGSMRSIASFAEALWWLRVNLDHAFDPGSPPKLPPGADDRLTPAL